MKRDTESTWAAERVENALLRERINDVAAEVARLTATLEGPGSPIESLLVEAASVGRAASAAGRGDGEAAANGDPARGEQEHARRPHPRAAIDRFARRFDQLTRDLSASCPAACRASTSASHSKTWMAGTSRP